MNRVSLSVLFLMLGLHVRADDATYRTALDAAHDRFCALEAERSDYRKVHPELPPAREEERLRLLGQFAAEDPVWVLSEQIESDILALSAIRSQTSADAAVLDSLKELLAITRSFEGRAKTHAQAEEMAGTLRKFVALRDAAGASAWTKSQ